MGLKEWRYMSQRTEKLVACSPLPKAPTVSTTFAVTYPNTLAPTMKAMHATMRSEVLTGTISP